MCGFWTRVFLVACVFQSISWCDSYKTSTFKVTVEAFVRENRAKRFLRSEWDEIRQTFKIAFNGRKDDAATRFIFRCKWTSSKNKKSMQFTLQPAGFPGYFLSVEERNLVMKNTSNVDPTESKYKFEMSKVALQYRDVKHNLNVTEYYNILKTRSRPARIVKSSKSGKVTLDKWKSWKDCQTWFKLQRIP